MMNRKTSFLFIFFLVLCLCVKAQFTKNYDDPDADFKTAKELYQKESFSLAYPLFEKLYNESLALSNFPITIGLEAKYYSIICGLALNDVSAVDNAVDFIALEHHEPRIEMMSYHLAEYYYRKKDFDEAINYYNMSGIDNLSNAQISTLKFHEGYSYFFMQKFSDAKPLFDAIRQIKEDENYYDANYYYGFICFNEKKYEQALSSFKIVEKRENYTTIIPYYITEIYYYQGKKDEALAYGENALLKTDQYYDLQMNQLVGHIYFEKANYTKALPLLEKYVSKTEKVSREDLYELSFCYYNAEQYRKAADGLKELGGKQDSLAQNSMYLLSDSYLKLGNKSGARSAFLFCALNSSNSTQKEVSKFNYGKLSYELGFTDVALNELKQFIVTYPRSNYNNEAKELLVNVLARTNNYKEALDLLKTISVKTDMVKRIYPQVLYGRAEELINDQQLDDADDLLNEIFKSSFNYDQLPYTNFWKGEIAFRKNEFDSTNFYLQEYLKSPVNYGDVNIKNARYTLGYSNLRQENFVAAQKYFEQITSNLTSSSLPIDVDIYLRNADCNYMQKKLSIALVMYEKVISLQLPFSDYALYQKAMIAGANDQDASKISTLQSIGQRFPSSTYKADANMEVANTYLASSNYQLAIAPLNSILVAKNNEAYKPQVFLKLGISYYNLKDNSNSLTNFQKLISQFSNSEESNNAIEYVRDIFIESQKPDEFVAFMKKNGKAISYSEEDSITYISAFNVYENKSFDNALKGFKNYLSKFTDGKYAIEANYYSADILNNKKDYLNALPYFSNVAAKAPNIFAEVSVLQAARICYFEQNDYSKAENFFMQLKSIATSPENKLESMRGLLRCQYKLADWSNATTNAQDLLLQKGIATDDKMMANMVIAKNYQKNNLPENASASYKTVISLGKSEYSAEARYRIAEILLSQMQFSEAEKAAFEVINKAGSYDYWITKAYILLGDDYFLQADYFNAEATLKSVVDNASILELKNEAQTKLDIVIAEKNKNSKIGNTN